MIVAGVDGCPDGWIAAIAEVETGSLTFRVFATFCDVLQGLDDAAAIGIDIPIGLMCGGSRQADSLARKRLPGKASSVFSAPHPDIIHEGDYKTANVISNGLIGKGISLQCFHILRKIAEVNDLLTPELQERFFEVHPEVSFAELNGSPMLSKKGKSAGFHERSALLQARSGFYSIPATMKEARDVVSGKVRADDVLDAIVAAWTAMRFHRHEACRIPVEPEIGFRGLRAEIVF